MLPGQPFRPTGRCWERYKVGVNTVNPNESARADVGVRHAHSSLPLHPKDPALLVACLLVEQVEQELLEFLIGHELRDGEVGG